VARFGTGHRKVMLCSWKGNCPLCPLPQQASSPTRISCGFEARIEHWSTFIFASDANPANFCRCLPIWSPVLQLDDLAVKISDFPISVKMDGGVMRCVRLHSLSNVR